MKLHLRIRHFIAENQILMICVALVLGYVFPTFFRIFAPYTTPLLMGVFFASSLNLDQRELFTDAKDWKMLLVTTFLMLIVMPFILWLPVKLFAPEWALAFLIVGAMPTGLTIALIAEPLGGRIPLAMIISAATSLLCPITIPLVLTLAIGKSINIPALPLFGSLMLTIVTPFVAALLVKAKAKKFITRYELIWREISILLFGVVIAAIEADSIGLGQKLPSGWDTFAIVSLMTICMGGIGCLGYAIANWRTPAERITIAMSLVYMNNTLALYVANEYFKAQNILPQLLVIVTAVSALLLPIKWAASHLSKKSSKLKLRVPHPIF